MDIFPRLKEAYPGYKLIAIIGIILFVALIVSLNYLGGSSILSVLLLVAVIVLGVINRFSLSKTKSKHVTFVEWLVLVGVIYFATPIFTPIMIANGYLKDNISVLERTFMYIVGYTALILISNYVIKKKKK